MTNGERFKDLFGLYATEVWAMPEKDFLEWLNTLTTAAEPIKHGTWGDNIYGYRKCSVCGRVTQVDECMREPLYLYCPYCGATMDEVWK